MTWFPQLGPQMAALECDWCDELFYGGERGGGKSDFQLGYQEDGALRYGKNWRGIMFRKTYAELEELQGRAMDIFPQSGGFFKSNASVDYPYSNCWYWPSGASVKMRYIENERDYGRYHGHQYCVGENTRIWMSDGSLLAIKDVVAGDLVATLEGPRRVLRTVPRYKAPCVKLKLPHGEQIQPIWHPVLSNAGCTVGLLPDGSRTAAQPQTWLAAQSDYDIYRNSQGSVASAASGQTHFSVSGDELPKNGPLLRSSVPVALVAQLVHLAADQKAKLQNSLDKQHELYEGKYPLATSSSYFDRWPPLELLARAQDLAKSVFAYVHGACARLVKPLIQDLTKHYENDSRPYDAQPLPLREAGPNDVPLPAYVVRPSHDSYLADGMDYIPEYNRQALYTYIHPYTKEPRHGVIPLESGIAQIEFCGDAYVCDLTIEGVNHYVSETGLVNKNTGISFDEVTEYATPSGLLRMLSTLRSAAGVPCTVRLTGNPGGVGHSWVKSRYIDVGPPRHPFTDPETGFTRMFIPSRLQDNAILLDSDPGYRNRILAATYGNEALRKAWLEGDWNIVAGAFFNCWSSQMVLRPVELPEWWTRFRSGDWGSARPFSFGWWAIAGDDFEHPDGPFIPRGALIRYREYYGCDDTVKNPNVGLKLPAEEVGQNIIHLERGEKISYGVLDPAAFSSDGGPSIAERLYIGSGNKLMFRKADNARVASKGAMGGWDQMRSRMLGEDGLPMIYTFSNCTDSIRTIPMLQHDENRVEDVNSDMEDHAADEWRYACMSRPYVRPKPVGETKPKFWHEQPSKYLFFPKGVDKRIERI